MNAFKAFALDYLEFCKYSFKFWKKHWKALCLITVVYVGAEIAIIEFNNVKYKIDNRTTDDFEVLESVLEEAESFLANEMINK